ncbi:MAG TPA: DUF6184 family natural product biosynthesis lipoprotein [Polyangiaceae bacterium]|jgi:hypothetical protein|nr:DUF6184 family natural product biosynthesis lipoprotein [Polyangiaceae bacterium]
MTPASRTTPAADVAAERIATARCDREQRCNQIGAGAKYSSRQHCMNVMGPKAADDVGDCRLGVDQKDLRECLDVISNEDCNAPLGELDRVIQCQADNLCLSESASEKRYESPKNKR